MTKKDKTKKKSKKVTAKAAKLLKEAKALKVASLKKGATPATPSSPARERAAARALKSAKSGKPAKSSSSKTSGSTRSSSAPTASPRNPLARKPNDPRITLADDSADLAAHKFDIDLNDPASEPTPRFELPEFEDLGELPAIYGTRKFFLTARDPHWLYAYWDLTHAQLSEGERAAHDGKLFLQLRHAGGGLVQQIQISPWSHDWYLHAEPNNDYHAEIGYYRADGAFESLARSPIIHTPPDSISWKTDARFVTIPFHFSFRQLLELIRAHRLPGEDLADALARLQDEGFPFPFDVHRPIGLTDESYTELLASISDVTLRRFQQGSGEIIELLRKSLLTQLSSGAWPGSSPSSPFGASFGAAPRDFFMDVNAELIIYGGTHPGARVRVDGEPIQLTPDGRFTYHFNFKDGKFHIPIEAHSPDGVETRSALLSFLRLTALTPGVEPTPQAVRPTPLGEVD
jgi:hypothetical protein